MRFDVAIVGGGISGLATAYELVRRGRRVVVLERQVRPGGTAVSERLGGFLMEHGPSTLNGASEAALGLSRALGLEGARCELGDRVRRRYLVDGGGLHGISTHPLGFLVSGYLSPGARLRLLAEAVVPRRAEDGDEETIEDFCRRRFGAEFAERVIDPLVAGIYAARAGEASVSALFPTLVEMERRHGSVCRGLARRRRGGRMPGSRLFSFAGGLGSLPRALAGALGGVVRSGIAVRRVRPAAGGYSIEAEAAGSIEARSVVLATQPHVTARLLDGLDEAGAEAASAIAAPPLAVVFLGYPRRRVAHPLDGLGFLGAEAEGRALNGAQFCSTMFPGRAPEGHVAVAGYIGGARAPELARLGEDELISIAREEFADLIGARGEPVVARVRHWPVGLPQYRLGHALRAAALSGLAERRPGLYATGNYLRGPSVAACLALALETAAEADAHLAASAAEAPPIRRHRLARPAAGR